MYIWPFVPSYDCARTQGMRVPHMIWTKCMCLTGLQGTVVTDLRSLIIHSREFENPLALRDRHKKPQSLSSASRMLGWSVKRNHTQDMSTNKSRCPDAREYTQPPMLAHTPLGRGKKVMPRCIFNWRDVATTPVLLLNHKKRELIPNEVCSVTLHLDGSQKRS